MRAFCFLARLRRYSAGHAQSDGVKVTGNALPKRDGSDDGVVPYASAHLGSAQSERVVRSEHRVQEMPEAILELRRILRLHGADDTPPPHRTLSGRDGGARL